MNTARKHSEQPKEPAYEKICDMINRLNHLAQKISRAEKFTPPQAEVDAAAREIIDIINTYHKNIQKYEVYLKNAILDLTEIPYMQPQMQKIAFEVAIKAAIHNLQSFLDHVVAGR
jgi:hypothetical protein